VPPFKPLKRRELVYYLRKAGFAGPFAGGKHEIMRREDCSLILPNPHRDDIGVNLLARILREADIQRSEWELLS